MLNTFRDVRLLVQILVASLKSCHVLRIIPGLKQFAVAALQSLNMLPKLLHEVRVPSEQGIRLAFQVRCIGFFRHADLCS